MEIRFVPGNQRLFVLKPCEDHVRAIVGSAQLDAETARRRLGCLDENLSKLRLARQRPLGKGRRRAHHCSDRCGDHAFAGLSHNYLLVHHRRLILECRFWYRLVPQPDDTVPYGTNQVLFARSRAAANKVSETCPPLPATFVLWLAAWADRQRATTIEATDRPRVTRRSQRPLPRDRRRRSNRRPAPAPMSVPAPHGSPRVQPYRAVLPPPAHWRIPRWRANKLPAPRDR